MSIRYCFMACDMSCGEWCHVDSGVMWRVMSPAYQAAFERLASRSCYALQFALCHPNLQEMVSISLKIIQVGRMKEEPSLAFRRSALSFWSRSSAARLSLYTLSYVA